MITRYLFRLYNTNNGHFTKTQTIEARDVGWSVLDVAVSDDNAHDDNDDDAR